MMLKALCSLVILAAALLSSSARGSEMFFSTDDVGQMWLQIVGRIDDGDDVKFRNMLSRPSIAASRLQGFRSIPREDGKPGNEDRTVHPEHAPEHRRSPARAAAGTPDLRHPHHERSNDRAELRAVKKSRRSTVHMRRRVFPGVGRWLRQARRCHTNSPPDHTCGRRRTIGRADD